MLPEWQGPKTRAPNKCLLYEMENKWVFRFCLNKQQSLLSCHCMAVCSIGLNSMRLDSQEKLISHRTWQFWLEEEPVVGHDSGSRVGNDNDLRWISRWVRSRGRDGHSLLCKWGDIAWSRSLLKSSEEACLKWVWHDMVVLATAEDQRSRKIPIWLWPVV